jgi:hypothetical protein
VGCRLPSGEQQPLTVSSLAGRSRFQKLFRSQWIRSLTLLPAEKPDWTIKTCLYRELPEDSCNAEGGGTPYPPCENYSGGGLPPHLHGGEVGGTSPPPFLRIQLSYSFMGTPCSAHLHRNSKRSNRRAGAQLGTLLMFELGGGGCLVWRQEEVYPQSNKVIKLCSHM